MDFHCEICGAGFYYKSYLSKHKSRIHGIKTAVATGEFTCEFCEKRFSSKKTLSAHTVRVHDIKKLSIECQEENCEQKFHTLGELRNHLQCHHGILNIDDCQNFEFVKFEDFDEWLQEVEKKTNSKFVISSKRTINDCKYITYSCNRSGYYKPVTENRQRQLKAQGTRKLGFHCTSSIQVKELDSKILVSYYKEHYKHSTDLSRIPIPKTEKELIAGKLLQGVQKKRILDDIRKTDESIIERKHLITPKDINNINLQFGLPLHSKGSVITNDEMSVCAWVKKMENEHFNPVLFYKRQGDAHSVLDEKDFMLVIMTTFQKTMLNRFGADRVCIDSTHGISGYQFELVTLMVIDEFEEGVPVTFCITSTVDTKTISFFLNCVKCTLASTIKPSVFMSDDAPLFKNAWISVFGPCDKYLLCAWHVDRAWKKNLTYLNLDIRQDIYKTLKTLMYELDECEFREMLINFREMLSDDTHTKRFYDYFIPHYFDRPEVWAYCFRKKAKINTNMHIENFHRSLKHIYLEGKKTKRVDKVIDELLNLVRDKNYDQFIKSVKGKITKRATQNFKRHKEGKNLNGVIKEVCQNKWEVISSANVYTISKIHICTNTCIIACRSCAICATAYSCTCHDYAISNFMCKHIHFLKISSNEVQNYTGPIISQNTIQIITTASENISDNTSTRKHKSNIKKMTSLLAKLSSLPNVGQNASNQIGHHLNAIEHLMLIDGENILRSQDINVEPSNKKILTQKRFHSVKKPRSNKKIKMSKPSSAEIADKKAILLKQIYCSHDSTFDHKY